MRETAQVRSCPRETRVASPLDVMDRLIRQSGGWLRTAIAPAYCASARSGEARAMRVRDIDFRAGMLNVRVAYSHRTLTMPKSGAERRVPVLFGNPIVGARSKAPKTFVATRAGYGLATVMPSAAPVVSEKPSPRESCGLPAVVVEQSAETRSASDRAERRVVVAWRCLRSDDLAADPLVVALGQIVPDELLDQVPQVPLAENDDVIQALR